MLDLQPRAESHVLCQVSLLHIRFVNCDPGWLHPFCYLWQTGRTVDAPSLLNHSCWNHCSYDWYWCEMSPPFLPLLVGSLLERRGLHISVLVSPPASPPLLPSPSSCPTGLLTYLNKLGLLELVAHNSNYMILEAETRGWEVQSQPLDYILRAVLKTDIHSMNYILHCCHLGWCPCSCRADWRILMRVVLFLSHCWSAFFPSGTGFFQALRGVLRVDTNYWELLSYELQWELSFPSLWSL